MIILMEYEMHGLAFLFQKSVSGSCSIEAE
jgi:hypothetical protein